jgi:hypothetical protein
VCISLFVDSGDAAGRAAAHKVLRQQLAGLPRDQQEGTAARFRPGDVASG